MKRARLVVIALMLAAATGCAGIDLTPSSVETWSGPPFPVDRVTTIDVLPAVDARKLDRGSSITAAQLVREAAISLLGEKGYATTASGPALAAIATPASAADVLDAGAIADRCPTTNGFVLALAIEETAPDVLVAPATARVRLRGAIVDVADRTVVWSGASVAEAASPSGAIAMSPTATLYSAVFQAMRALLADLPARPAGSATSPRDTESWASGSPHPRRAIDGGVGRCGGGCFAVSLGAEVRG